MRRCATRSVPSGPRSRIGRPSCLRAWSLGTWRSPGCSTPAGPTWWRRWLSRVTGAASGSLVLGGAGDRAWAWTAPPAQLVGTSEADFWQRCGRADPWADYSLDPAWWLHDAAGVHGVGHCARVAIWADRVAAGLTADGQAVD